MNYEDRRRKVEKLLHGKYPFSWAPPPLAPLRTSAVGHEVARFNRAEHERLLQEIDAERRSLSDKTDAEIDAAFDAYLSELRIRGKLDAENKELVRFFNLPGANADVAYWSKVEYWSLDESVALLLGKSPEVVNWDSIKSFVNISAFAKQYERLRNLAARAQQMNRGQSGIYPKAVLAWAADMDVPVPQGLKDAMAEHLVRRLTAATSRAEAARLGELLARDAPLEMSAIAQAQGATPAKVAMAEKMGNAITPDGAPRAAWMLGLGALLPALELALGRRAKVREVIKHLKANGASYRILPEGGPDEMLWKTQMGDKKPVVGKTISNAISDWRKSRPPV